MRKNNKKWWCLAPFGLVIGGLVAASSVSNFLLFGVDAEIKNVSFNNRDTTNDPQNPDNYPANDSSWYTMSYDSYEKFSTRKLTNAFQKITSTNNWTRFATPAASLLGSDNKSGLGSFGTNGLRLGHNYSTSSTTLSGMDAKTNSNKQQTGVFLQPYFSSKAPIGVDGKSRSMIGGFDSSYLNRDNYYFYDSTFFFNRGFYVNDSASSVSSTYGQRFDSSASSKKVGPNGVVDRVWMNTSKFPVNGAYSNPSSNTGGNIYLGTSGKDRYLGAVQIRFAYAVITNYDMTPWSKDIYLKAENSSNSYYFRNPVWNDSSDSRSSGWLSSSGGYDPASYTYKHTWYVYQAWRPWSAMVSQGSISSEILYAFNGYYEKNISMYFTKNSINNQYSVSTINNDNKQYYYPSQVVKNPDLIGKIIDLTYSEWEPRFYLSNVQYKYNDDLGKLYLKIKPGPTISQTGRDKKYVNSFNPSSEINFTISGFKANNTSWNTNIVTFRNAASTVASIDNVTIQMLKQEMWQQMIANAEQKNNYWYSKNDVILTNWDRIPGFNMDSFVIPNLVNENFNIREGTVTVNVGLKKAIINAEVVSSNSATGLLQQEMTFNGFYKITSKSAVNRSWLSIGNGSSLSILENDTSANKETSKQWLKNKIFDYENKYNLTDNSIFKNVDIGLLKGNNAGIDNFEILDFIPNYAAGSVDVYFQLNRTYDPDIYIHGSIGTPLKSKITLSGFAGKPSSKIETNQSTRILVNNKLIGQQATSNNGFKGIGSNATNLINLTNDSSLSGNSVSNIQSIYYDRIRNNYVGLYFSTSDSTLSINTSSTPSFNSAYDDMYAARFANLPENYQLPGSLSEDMRMIPLNNVTGNVSSYIAFPAGATGESNNNYVYYVQINQRGVLIKKILNLPNLGDGQYIVSVGGYDFNTVNNINQLRLDYVIADSSSNKYTYNVIFATSSYRDQYTYNFSHNIVNPISFSYSSSTFEKNLYSFNFNNSNKLIRINDELTNNVLPIHIPVYRNDENKFTAAWTRVSGEGNAEVRLYETSTPVTSQNQTARSYTMPIANSSNSSTTYNTNFSISDYKSIYSSINQDLLILNLNGKENSVDGNYSSKNVATIIDLKNRSDSFNIVLGDNSKKIELMPDSTSQYINYSITSDSATNSLISAKKVETSYDTEYVANTSIIDIYNNYLEMSSTDFSNYLVSNFIYDPTKNINNLIDLPLDYNKLNQSITDSLHVQYEQIYFDFDNNEVNLVLVLDKSISSNLWISKNSMLFKIKTNDQSIQQITNIQAVANEWSKVDSDPTSLNNKINEINNAKNYDKYITINNPINDTTNNSNNNYTPSKILDGSLSLVNLDQASAKAELAVTLSSAVSQVGNNIQIVKNKVFNFEVNLKPSLPTMVSSVDASVYLTTYVNSYPSTLMSKINNNDTALLNALKQALIDQLKKNNESSNFEDSAYPSVDEIIFSDAWNFNNSSGQLWTNVSIPKYAGTDDVESNPYLNVKIVFNNFSSLPATTVSQINYSSVDTLGFNKPNVSPSNLQQYLDQNWYHIYQFVTINNPFGELKPIWMPYTPNLNYDPTNPSSKQFVYNKTYSTTNLDNLSAQELQDINNNNTTISAQVMSYDDDAGTAEVNIYIKNCYSSEDNTYLQPDNTPFIDDVVVQTITLTGLTSNNNAALTKLNSNINVTFASSDTEVNMVPTQIINSSQDWLKKQIWSTNSVVDGVNNTNINFVKLEPNNKLGTIDAWLTFEKVIAIDGSIISGDDIVYKTTFSNFRKANGPTTVSLNNTNLPEMNILNLESKLFDQSGNINGNEAISLLKQLITVTNAPNNWEKEVSNGKVVNIDVNNNSATVKFTLASFFANDNTYSLLNDLEVCFDLQLNKNTTTLSNLKLLHQDKNGNILDVTSDLSIKNNEINSTFSQENKTDLLLIISLSSSIILLILFIFLAIYIKWLKKYQG